MSDLPPGWCHTEIGLIAEVETGGTPPKSDPSLFGGKYPFFKPGDLDRGGTLVRAQETLSEAGLKKARRLPAGSVLVSCIGNLGKSGITATEGASNQQINAVLPTPAAEPWYLYYWTRTIRPWLEENASATTIAIINKGRFSKAPIALPPLAEQRRIMAKLDALTARSTRARADLDRIPALAARYKQAVLTMAFSGELTAEWRQQHAEVAFVASEVIMLRQRRAAYQDGRRGSRLREVPSLALPGECPDLPSTWASGCVADVADLRVGYAFKSSWFKDDGVPLIRGANVGVGVLDCEDFKYLPAEQAREFDAYRLSEGDILLAMDRPLISTGLKIARVPQDAGGALLVQRVASPITTPLVDRDFLWWLFHSQHYLGQIARHATGSDLPHVSGNDILTTSAPLPPLSEQVEIARRIARAFAEIDRLTAEAAAARRLLDRLDQAVLTKAFRGELVPQDPADEPANVLLERIHAERAAAPKPKRGRRAAAA